MRVLGRPYRLEAARFQRLAELAGRHRVIGEEHRRAEIHAAPSPCGAGAPKPDLGETDPDRLGTLATLGDVDQHALAFVERADP